MNRHPVRLAFAIAGAVLLVACTRPSHTYVQDETTGTQYVLPDGWRTEQLPSEADPGNPLAVPTGLVTEEVFGPGDSMLPGTWHPFTDFPFGYVRVRSLSPTEQEEMSLKSLRAAVLDVDAAQADDPASVQILDQQMLSVDGFRGEHMLYSWHVVPDDPSAPPMTVTVDQTTYLDPFTSTEYVFVVACSSDCFLESSETIQAITGSWSVVPT